MANPNWLQLPSIFDPEVAPREPQTNTVTHICPRVEAALLEILEQPPDPKETIAIAFARKEAAVGDFFAELDVNTSRALHARLSSSRDGDQLVSAFVRMTPERRERLLVFLADVRRRQARLSGRARR